MAFWIIENKQEKAIKIILFLLSPFLSLLYSFRSIKTKSSFVVFFLFAIFFGMSFTVSNVRTQGSIDGITYRAFFESYKYVTSTQFYDDFINFIKFSGENKDYYFDTVAFFVSRFTDNYHVMFMVFAIVFGFFALKSFSFLTKEKSFDANYYSYILAYIFMINHIFNINGMRFWTAAWVGIYAIFQIFSKGNKWYFLLILITPFFHGTYWILVGIITVALFLQRFEKFWFYLFIISFFISSFSFEFIRLFSELFPDYLMQTIELYTDPEYVKFRNEEGAGFYWIERLFNLFVQVYMNIAVYLFYKNSLIIRLNNKTGNLYLFLLVLITFVNFMMPVPSLGKRFFYLIFPVIAYVWLVNFRNIKYLKFLYLAPVVFLFTFYQQLLQYLQVLDASFFISSPVYLIYKYLLLR